MNNNKSIFFVALLMASVQFINGAEHLRGMAGRLNPAKYQGIRFFITSLSHEQLPDVAWEVKHYTRIPIKVEIINQYPFLREQVKEFWAEDVTDMDKKMQTAKTFTIPLGPMLKTQYLKGRIGDEELRTFVQAHAQTHLQRLQPKNLIDYINLANVLGGTKTKEEEREEMEKDAREGSELELTFIERCAQELTRRITLDDILKFFGLPAGKATGIWLQRVSEFFPYDVLDYVLAKYIMPKAHLPTTLIRSANLVDHIVKLPGNGIASSSSKTIIMSDLNTNQPVATLTEHDYRINHMLLLSDNRLASAAKTIKIWNPASNQLEATLTNVAVPRHREKINHLVELPHNKLAAAFNNNSIEIWNLTTNQFVTDLLGHTAPVKYLVALPGDKLASVSDDNTIKIWNLTTNELIATLDDHTDRIKHMVLLPGDRLASASWDNTVKVWDLNTNQLITTLNGHTDGVNYLAPLPENKLASASWDNTVKIWDLNTNQLATTLTGHTDAVYYLTPRPNNRLISASEDKTIRIWDHETGKPIEKLTGHTMAAKQLIDMPNKKIVSRSDDRTVKAWSKQPLFKSASFNQALAVRAAKLMYKKESVVRNQKLNQTIETLSDEDRQAFAQRPFGW